MKNHGCRRARHRPADAPRSARPRGAAAERSAGPPGGDGICHTDMAMRDHKIYPIPHPAVLGHEGAGIVERVGQNVTKVQPAITWC